jgi:hypothetical protein
LSLKNKGESLLDESNIKEQKSWYIYNKTL